MRRWPDMGRDIAKDLGGLGQSIAGFGSSVMRFADNPLVQSFGARIGWVYDKMIEGMTRLVNFGTWAVDSINAITTDPAGWARDLGQKIYGVAVHEQKLGPNPVLATDPNFAFRGMSGGAFDVFRAGLQNDLLNPKKDPEFTPPPVVKIDKVEVKVEAERLDDPNTVARTFEAAMAKVLAHPKSVRAGRLVPKPL